MKKHKALVYCSYSTQVSSVLAPPSSNPTGVKTWQTENYGNTLHLQGHCNRGGKTRQMPGGPQGTDDNIGLSQNFRDNCQKMYYFHQAAVNVIVRVQQSTNGVAA